MGFVDISVLADWCSVVGVPIALVGLLWTYLEARAAKSAAEQARLAAFRMREDLDRFDVIAVLSQAGVAIEEIKTLQRHGAWGLIPSKYSSLKQSLNEVRGKMPGLPEEHQRSLQGTIQMCASIENEIEIAHAGGAIPSDVPRLNRALSKRAVALQLVISHMRNEIGGD